MIRITDFYNLKTYPESLPLDECDTILIGEDHRDVEIRQVAKKIIEMHNVPGSVLLIENIPSLESSSTTLMRTSASEYVKVFVEGQKRDYLCKELMEKITILGWDDRQHIDSDIPPLESLEYCEQFIKFIGDQINPILFQLQTKSYLTADRLIRIPVSFYDINRSAPGYLRNSIFSPQIAKISIYLQPLVDEVLDGLKQVISIINTVKYDELEEYHGCTCPSEIKSKMLSEMIPAMSLKLIYCLTKLNDEQTKLRSVYESIYLDRSFPARTLSMVETLKKVHSTPSFRKCFLTAGSSHLDEANESRLSPMERPFYSLKPLVSYLESCEKKVAILIPKNRK